MEGRIRKRIKTHHKGGKLRIPMVEYFFTYKRRLKTQKGSLELEMKISQHDFDLAWQEGKQISLEKTRYCLHMPWREMWEVDFFKTYDTTYFVLAECELLSHAHKPKGMPDIVKNNLIYIVPDDDMRFKNKQLADPIKAAQLLKDISVESLYGEATKQNEALPLQSIFSS